VARIAGVNIPTNKRVVIALRYIHGIGPVNAVEICDKVKIPHSKRVNELSDAEVLAIREVLDLIGPRLGHGIPVTHADWRPGDQRVFVADVSRARDLLGWAPSTPVDAGVGRLYEWVVTNRTMFV